VLDAQTVRVVKQTAPILGEHAEALTRLFYKRMFQANPEVRPFFNPAHQQAGTQQRALAGAIVAYATHIEDLDQLTGAVDLIAHKHVSLGVKPEHYPIVGENLIAAIKELLGVAATDEIVDAWTKAYGFLADVLINHESGLYTNHEQRHGWRDFTRFRVARKQPESEVIQSFYLEPTADAPPACPMSGFRASHQPGQFLTVRVPTEDGSTTMRNYSISVAPGQPYYRISVKREAAPHDQAPHGVVSNHLHERLAVGDTLEVGPPCGNFVLDASAGTERPLVLISGGVGVTPVLAMLHAAVQRPGDQPIYFVHAARNGKVHAFADEVAQIAKANPRVQVHACYDQPTDEDHERQQHDHTGRVDLPLLQHILPGPDADFYFCGPKPFMQGVQRALSDWGVDPERVRFEWFGPAQELAATN
jgi:nitric oxide dioxygenase